MLGPSMVQHDLILDFVKDRAGERGGICSFLCSSGVLVCTYAEDPSNASPIGIQLNDVEHMDLSRQFHPALDRRVRRVDQPHTTVGLSSHGTFDTNFIHPDASPSPGGKVYLAPSGLVTSSPSFGGEEIGKFLGYIDDPALAGLPKGQTTITIYGGGFTRGDVFEMRNGLPTVNNYDEQPATLLSPGWVRIRIKI